MIHTTTERYSREAFSTSFRPSSSVLEENQSLKPQTPVDARFARRRNPPMPAQVIPKPPPPRSAGHRARALRGSASGNRVPRPARFRRGTTKPGTAGGGRRRPATTGGTVPFVGSVEWQYGYHEADDIPMLRDSSEEERRPGSGVSVVGSRPGSRWQEESSRIPDDLWLQEYDRLEEWMSRVSHQTPVPRGSTASSAPSHSRSSSSPRPLSVSDQLLAEPKEQVSEAV